MTYDSVRNFSSLINLYDDIEMSIDKARAVLDLMISANLNEHTGHNLHLCLIVVDDLLEEAMLFKRQLY